MARKRNDLGLGDPIGDTDETVDIPVPDLGAEIPAESLPSLEETLAITDPEPEADEPGAPTAEEPKRRRRRRKQAAKVEDAEPVNPMPSEEEIAAMGKVLGLGFRTIFAMVASRRGDHWRLDDNETATIGQAWSVACAPYFHHAGKYLAFATAAITTVGVVSPRLDEDARRVANLPDNAKVGAGES